MKSADKRQTICTPGPVTAELKLLKVFLRGKTSNRYLLSLLNDVGHFCKIKKTKRPKKKKNTGWKDPVLSDNLVLKQ